MTIVPRRRDSKWKSLSCPLLLVDIQSAMNMGFPPDHQEHPLRLFRSHSVSWMSTTASSSLVNTSPARSPSAPPEPAQLATRSVETATQPARTATAPRTNRCRRLTPDRADTRGASGPILALSWPLGAPAQPALRGFSFLGSRLANSQRKETRRAQPMAPISKKENGSNYLKNGRAQADGGPLVLQPPHRHQPGGGEQPRRSPRGDAVLTEARRQHGGACRGGDWWWCSAHRLVQLQTIYPLLA